MKTARYFFKISFVVALITVVIPQFLTAQEGFNSCFTIQNELIFESNPGVLDGESNFEEQDTYVYAR